MHRRLSLLPSAYLAALLTAMHGLALVALAVVLPAWAAIATGGLILASLAYYLLRDAWLRLGTSCVGLATDAEGVEIILRDGRRLPGVILNDSLVTPALVVLNVRPQGARGIRSVLILPDSVDAESFRQLRVWLKWGEYGQRRSARREGDARE